MVRTILFLGATAACVLGLCRETRAQPAVMKWVDFNGAELPRNKAGDAYPSQYQGEGSRASVSLDDKDAISGRSVRFEVTQKSLYAHFNPYDADGARGLRGSTSPTPINGDSIPLTA